MIVSTNEKSVRITSAKRYKIFVSSDKVWGRFPYRHFCLYFELGCELGPSEAQTQNTSKNDDLENGPIFLFDFCVGTDS